MTAAEQLVERIDRALEHLPRSNSSYPVLEYVRKQITPSGLARRSDDDQNVAFLHEVAKERLRDLDKKEIPNDR